MFSPGVCWACDEPVMENEGIIIEADGIIALLCKEDCPGK